jgi:hypothetical protein
MFLTTQTWPLSTNWSQLRISWKWSTWILPRWLISLSRLKSTTQLSMDQSRWESSLRYSRFLQTSKPLKRMLTSKSWEWTQSCKPTSMRDRETIRKRKSSRRPGITISTTISPFRRALCSRFKLRISVTTFRALTVWYIISRFKWPNNLSSISRTRREW